MARRKKSYRVAVRARMVVHPLVYVEVLAANARQAVELVKPRAYRMLQAMHRELIGAACEQIPQAKLVHAEPISAEQSARHHTPADCPTGVCNHMADEDDAD